MSDKVAAVKSAISHGEGADAANKLDELKNEKFKGSGHKDLNVKEKTEANKKFQSEVLDQLNADLFNHGKAIPAKDKHAMRAIGTHKEGKENYVVFADFEKGKDHDVYLMGNDHKFHKASVNEKAKNDGEKFKLTGETVDTLPGLTLDNTASKVQAAYQSAKEAGADSAPRKISTKSEQVAPAADKQPKVEVTPFVRDVREMKVTASGDREWTVRNSMEDGKVTPDSITFKQKAADGSTIEQVYAKDLSRDGRWVCYEKTQPVNGPETPFEKKEGSYGIQANKDSLSISQLDTGMMSDSAKRRETYLTDGTRITEQARSSYDGTWVKQVVPMNRKDGLTGPSEVTFSDSADAATPINQFKLTHKYAIGDHSRAVYTKVGAQDENSMYTWDGKHMKKFEPEFDDCVKQI